MGTNSSGIGVDDRGGGGINAHALSIEFCGVGMEEMVARRTVICFGKSGIVIFFGGFGCGIIVVTGAIGCGASSESVFVKCVSKCSLYTDSMENNFAHTLHCHLDNFDCFTLGAAVCDGATGFRL